MVLSYSLFLFYRHYMLYAKENAGRRKKSQWPVKDPRTAAIHPYALYAIVTCATLEAISTNASLQASCIESTFLIVSCVEFCSLFLMWTTLRSWADTVANYNFRRIRRNLHPSQKGETYDSYFSWKQCDDHGELPRPSDGIRKEKAIENWRNTAKLTTHLSQTRKPKHEKWKWRRDVSPAVVLGFLSAWPRGNRQRKFLPVLEFRFGKP